MKNKFFKLLHKIFSFLADKTNGWKIFVNPKLFFGALITGVTVVAASSCKPQPEEPSCYLPEPTCYDPIIENSIPQNDTISEVMCYDIAPPNVE